MDHDTFRPPPAALEAENAALRTVARAANEWEAAQRRYVGLFEASAYEGEVIAAEHRLNRAEDALRSALDALPAEVRAGLEAHDGR